MAKYKLNAEILCHTDALAREICPGFWAHGPGAHSGLRCYYASATLSLWVRGDRQSVVDGDGCEMGPGVEES